MSSVPALVTYSPGVTHWSFGTGSLLKYLAIYLEFYTHLCSVSRGALRFSQLSGASPGGTRWTVSICAGVRQSTQGHVRGFSHLDSLGVGIYMDHGPAHSQQQMLVERLNQQMRWVNYSL